MANLKNTNIDNNLELPSGTTGERPSSPQEGQIRYNTDLAVTEFYNGENWRPLSDTHPEATGGTVVDTDIGGVPYRIHYFTEIGTDTLTVTNPGEVEYLIVAGGGGGGDTSGGGGGAGGVITGSTYASVSTYTFTVGAGGEGSNAYSSGTSGDGGDKGNNSTAFGLTALGGGGGGSYSGSSNIINGGSGGGVRGDGQSRNTGASGGIALQPTSASGGFGNKGGDTPGLSNGDPSSGGGGAGSPGQDCTNEKGGDGGQGLVFGITGANLFYAGGGGGSGGYIVRGGGVERNGIGGIGGGGNGGRLSRFQDDPFITDGVPNTGGGAGGGGYDDSGNPAGTKGGGTGGSGIVIIRYPRNSSLDSKPDETRPSFQPYNYARDVRPIVARDGLVLELDAANPLSYSGTGTTWSDLSGNGNDANLIEPKFVSSQFGYFLFDRPDDRIQAINIPHSAEMNNGNLLTAEFWFNSPVTGWSTGASNNIFASKGSPACFYGQTCSGWNIGLKNDNRFFVALDTDYYNNPVPVFLNTGEFTHMVFTFDNESLRIYKNGILEYTDNTGPKNIDSTDKIAISDIEFGGPRTLNGFLSTVRIYNRALSIAEIQQNFNATRSRYGI